MSGIWTKNYFSPFTKFLKQPSLIFPLSVARRDKIHEDVSRVLRVLRVIVKVPACLKNDLRFSRVWNTIFGPFLSVLVIICLPISVFPKSFYAVLNNFPGCSWGIFELLRVLNTPRFLRLLFQGVNTVLVRGCHWEGQCLYNTFPNIWNSRLWVGIKKTNKKFRRLKR